MMMNVNWTVEELSALDAQAQQRYGKNWTDLDDDQMDDILEKPSALYIWDEPNETASEITRFEIGSCYTVKYANGKKSAYSAICVWKGETSAEFKFGRNTLEFDITEADGAEMAIRADEKHKGIRISARTDRA